MVGKRTLSSSSMAALILVASASAAEEDDDLEPIAGIVPLVYSFRS